MFIMNDTLNLFNEIFRKISLFKIYSIRIHLV